MFSPRGWMPQQVFNIHENPKEADTNTQGLCSFHLLGVDNRSREPFSPRGKLSGPHIFKHQDHLESHPPSLQTRQNHLILNKSWRRHETQARSCKEWDPTRPSYPEVGLSSWTKMTSRGIKFASAFTTKVLLVNGTFSKKRPSPPLIQTKRKTLTFNC